MLPNPCVFDRRRELPIVLALRRSIFVEPPVVQLHRKKLFFAESILFDRGIVDREKFKRRRVVDPQRVRIAVEQQSVSRLGDPERIFGARALMYFKLEVLGAQFDVFHHHVERFGELLHFIEGRHIRALCQVAVRNVFDGRDHAAQGGGDDRTDRQRAQHANYENEDAQPQHGRLAAGNDGAEFFQR